jgi:hypothetical protein
MRLFEIAEKVGVPVCKITPEIITQVREEGLITGKQEKKLLAELKKADNIWQPLTPGVTSAASLW